MNKPDDLALKTTLSLSQRLAAHIAGVDRQRIPAASFASAKLFMLDTLAVAWAGSDAPGCPEIHGWLAEEGGRAASSAWAYPGRLPAASAAMLNGTSAAALDYDSLGSRAPSHVSIVVLPAALAVAEQVHASGEAFLDAFVIGCDVMCRLGAAIQLPHRGFFYTSSIGGLGAAAAAARLLKLDAAQTAHALGLAFCQASGTQQTNVEPSLAKRTLSGFAARAGVTAAALAQRGLTAPANVIEGPFGVFKLYQPGSAEVLVDGLGTRFRNTELSVKKYPSCGCNHTAIAATLQLVRQYDLQPDDIESAEVAVSPFINTLVGMPYDPSGDPQVAAQFSIRYSIACALVRRKLGLAEIQRDAALDPVINQHVPKVSVRVDPALTGERGPVTVSLRSRKHGAIACTVEHVPGSDESPLSEADLNEKFSECFQCGAAPLSKAQIALLTERVQGLERVADMASFFDGISPR
jgi:2-methylcitrate dehydratase PrpD